ncbi:MAG: helix-turn-helix domain-containing protein [Lawsonibacter sp.]|jgi:transcriptional regulator with XRE-family HTH domain
MRLGEKIVQQRTALKLSQGDLAEKLEVSRQSVSKWETGQSVPDLDKIIKLADLFGISVDELVREEERPQPPDEEPQVVYVKEKAGLTGVQVAGVCLEALAGVLVLLGLIGMGWFVIILGVAMILLGLPLLLARKHPWIIDGWLLVGLSLLIFNPYTSVTPWGLLGGLQLLILCFSMPDLLMPTYLFVVPIAVGRGILSLALIWFTWRAWQNREKKTGQGRR